MEGRGFDAGGGAGRDVTDCESNERCQSKGSKSADFVRRRRTEVVNAVRDENVSAKTPFERRQALRLNHLATHNLASKPGLVPPIAVADMTRSSLASASSQNVCVEPGGTTSLSPGLATPSLPLRW